VNIIGALVAKVATNHFAMGLIRERGSRHKISTLPKMKRYISVAAKILAINQSATVRTTISKLLLLGTETLLWKGVRWDDDDGPGLAVVDRSRALTRGDRLDETVPGSGLGLSIACEIAELYSGTAELGVSELGGLKVELILPAAPK